MVSRHRAFEQDEIPGLREPGKPVGRRAHGGNAVQSPGRQVCQALRATWSEVTDQQHVIGRSQGRRDRATVGTAW